MLLELGSVVLGSILRAAIGVMDAPLRRLASGSRRSECGQSEPRVDVPANRIADDAPRPGIDNGRQIDEADRDGDVSDVGDPELVRSCRQNVFSQVGEDLSVVAKNSLRGRTVSPCSRIWRITFL